MTREQMIDEAVTTAYGRRFVGKSYDFHVVTEADKERMRRDLPKIQAGLLPSKVASIRTNYRTIALCLALQENVQRHGT